MSELDDNDFQLVRKLVIGWLDVKKYKYDREDGYSYKDGSISPNGNTELEIMNKSGDLVSVIIDLLPNVLIQVPFGTYHTVEYSDPEFFTKLENLIEYYESS